MVKMAASVICGVLGLGFVSRARHIVQHWGWGLSQKTYKLQTNEETIGLGVYLNYLDNCNQFN